MRCRRWPQLGRHEESEGCMKSLLLILLLQATGPTNQYDLMDIVHFPANGAPWWMVHVNNNSTISFSPQYTPTMAASDLWSQRSEAAMVGVYWGLNEMVELLLTCTIHQGAPLAG